MIPARSWKLWARRITLGLIGWTWACSEKPVRQTERLISAVASAPAPSPKLVVDETDSLTFTLSLQRVEIDTLRYIGGLTSVQNRSRRPVRVRWTGCYVPLLVLRSTDSGEALVWDERRWPGPFPGETIGHACLLDAPDTVLARGDTLGPPRLMLGSSQWVGSILGDSLSPGPYRIAILLSINGDSVQVEGGRINLQP